MTNKNYVRGSRREYAIKHALEKEGMIVCRTAGSHSQFDLIALDPATNIINFIQVKPKNMSKNAREALWREISWVERIWTGKAFVISFAKEIKI